MPRIPRKPSESGFYHVFSRGSGRQIIFEDASDNERFLTFLADSLKGSGISLHAFCLMSNHYHLVVQSQLAPLSDFAYTLNGNYARYFNKVHNHVGHLFQDRFRSEPIDNDEYFLAAIRYVHRNPVEAGLTSTCAYPWSSYTAYIGAASGLPFPHTSVPVQTSTALAMLGSVEAFSEFHAHSGKQSFSDDTFIRSQLAVPDILAIAREALGGIDPANVKSLPKPDRDCCIHLLRSTNLSIRQIALATSISHATIQRICAK